MGKADDGYTKRRFVNENPDGAPDSDVFALKFCHRAPNTHLFLATCRNYLSVFRCNPDGTTDRVCCFIDIDENEAYYVCEWVVQPDGSSLALAAGRKGVIQMYTVPSEQDYPDSIAPCAALTLEAHTEEVNDLQAHPTLTHLLLSAGHDNYIRLWDLRIHACIAVFGGPAAAGHLSAVTCVAWQRDRRDSTTFVSGGWDACIRIWDISYADKALRQAEQWPTLQQRRELAAAGKPHPHFPFAKVSWAAFESPEVHAEVVTSKAPAKATAAAAAAAQDADKEPPRKAAAGTTSQREAQWLDCIECVGPAVISRSGPIMPSSTNCNLKLWEPLPALGPPSALGPPIAHRHKVYKTFSITCKSNIWWVRFSLCAARRVLAAGNDHGDVYVHIVPSHSSTHTALLDTGITSVVRSTAVSADGRTILAGTSCGRIYRWDRRAPAAKPASSGPSRSTQAATASTAP